MNVQAIIVSIIILAALLYVALLVWRKVKSFSTKGACGAGCGCDANSKSAKILIKS
jgi:hypothetical protein